MSKELAKFINSKDANLRKIFAPSFQTAKQWADYLAAAFPDPTAPVTSLLAQDGGAWTAQSFHALAIACWIHFPTEKGSYMIELKSDQLGNAVGGIVTSGLKKRISSHFSGKGFSAAPGWAFLKGYGELLVQVEDKCLFLKPEGHPIEGIIDATLHGLGYLKKLATGAGETANKTLKQVAKSEDNHGITARAAENFSVPYEALLKSLGLYDVKKKKSSVQEAARLIHDKGLAFLNAELPELEPRLVPLASRLAFKERDLDKLTNAQLGKLMELVFVPLAGEMDAAIKKRDAELKKAPKGTGKAISKELKEFIASVLKAKSSLLDLAKKLGEDAKNTESPSVVRYYEETRVAPAVLDKAVREFMAAL